MNLKPFLSLALCFVVTAIVAQERAIEKIRIDNETVAMTPSPWELINIDTKASLRGLHVYSENEIFASGTGGTMVSSIDGGTTWRVKVVEGAEELDFRDIHAIDEGTIVAITSGTPARIYRSTNGGLSWKMVYQHKDERVFLDSLSFWDDKRGVVMGDPITQRLFLLRTNDAGKSWKLSQRFPTTLPGEAGFAASGTNMIAKGQQKLMVALGSHEANQSNQTSRIVYTEDDFSSWKHSVVPIQRNPSSGIFSICFANEKDGVAIGGDYKNPDSNTSNYATTHDGGKSWSTPSPRHPPSGFRSCVAIWKNGSEIHFISVGTNGSDASSDLGNKWHRISNEGFHAIDFTENGRHGWAVGGDGRLARWLGIAKVRPVQMTEKTISKEPLAKPPIK